jgi:hypothetical protein
MEVDVVISTKGFRPMPKTAICISTLCAACLCAAVVGWADESSGPLSLEDIRQLRRDGREPKEIVEVARRRRLAFSVDDKTERTLRTLGFRKSMIEALRDAKTAADAEPRSTDDAGANLPGQQPAPALHAEEESRHAAYEQRVRAMVAASRLRYSVTPGASVTLIADSAATKESMRVIGTIELMIHKTFPPPLGRGPDRRSTYIVLCRTSAEYQQWLKTMFAVNNRAGLEGFDERQLQFALAAAGSMPVGMSIVDMQKVGSWTARAVAYNLGYLYMQGVTNNQAPAALLSGFGSVAESNFDGNPQVMLGVATYADTHLPGRSGNRWLGLLKPTFAANRADSIEQLLTNGIGAMEEIQYAEAWSFTQLLANDPPRFSKLIGEIRDGKSALESIRSVYETDDNKLALQWAKLVGGAR